MSATVTPWQSLRQRWLQVSQTPAGQALPSPCVSVCIMKPDANECQGCFRTLEEIAAWGMSTPAQQRIVWQRLGQRITQHFNEV
jgi:predicted Fe-S protein YdhL (DUF1289 family)